ncbi:ORF6N domain-containing protein [Patescibacteria group bacterium]|nr:ORF6N domain-containing protein [Patescibacteria group bacterium]MBU4368108.1 ORF6N domain-containing protein [Patescibacteria group bacterium]
MQLKNQAIIVPEERIEHKIFFIRGKKVMFDKDLAELYGVETRTLNQAVRRNIKRFPSDFMFQLDKKELEIWQSQFLRSQFVTLKRGQHIKYSPYVFTEQGVAMLSSVLNSGRAIQVNIQIMRTFTKLREMIASNQQMRVKIEQMEKKYDKKFKIVFDALRQFLDDGRDESVRKIGFKAEKSKT